MFLRAIVLFRVSKSMHGALVKDIQRKFHSLIKFFKHVNLINYVRLIFHFTHRHMSVWRKINQGTQFMPLNKYFCTVADLA